MEVLIRSCLEEHTGAILPSDWDSRSPKMPLRNLLNLRLSQGREIHNLGCDNSLKCFRMMGLQIVTEEIDRATLTRCVADEDDGFGMDKIRGDSRIPPREHDHPYSGPLCGESDDVEIRKDHTA